jgi:type II secretory pathway pseudopilin PulG
VINLRLQLRLRQLTVARSCELMSKFLKQSLRDKTLKQSLRLQLSQSCGQGLMELVVGLGLIGIVVGALAIVTTNSLRNSQFSKNQVQATKIAQENLEKVRTIRNNNFGICTSAQMPAATVCSPWSAVWGHPFFGSAAAPITPPGSTYILGTCTVDYPAPAPDSAQPFCLRYTAPATRGTSAGYTGFTYQIFVEDEAVNQKKVTSRAYWSDATGEHFSDLVTIFSRF